jgi:hypothetical protein
VRLRLVDLMKDLNHRSAAQASQPDRVSLRAGADVHRSVRTSVGTCVGPQQTRRSWTQVLLSTTPHAPRPGLRAPIGPAASTATPSPDLRYEDLEERAFARQTVTPGVTLRAGSPQHKTPSRNGCAQDGRLFQTKLT